MRNLQRISLLVAVVAASAGCDQATKHIAMQALRSVPGRSFLGDTFRLQYAENPGAFLSLGANLAAGIRGGIFTWGVGLFLAVLAGYALWNRKLSAVQVVAYALTLGGGWSNWVDRFYRHGLVVDFMNLGIGSLRTGIFNVADLAIVAGLVLLVLAPTPPVSEKAEPVSP